MFDTQVIWAVFFTLISDSNRNVRKFALKRLDIRPNVGNYVMIQAPKGYVVLLAHLRYASIKIEEGQQIKTGDLIGNIGNSGNSTMPHLHINIFDQMDNPLSAKVLPFVFSEYLELNENNKWVKHSHDVPKVKSFVKI